MSSRSRRSSLIVLSTGALLLAACGDDTGEAEGSESATTDTSTADTSTTTSATTVAESTTTAGETTSATTEGETGEPSGPPPDLYCPGDPSGRCDPIADAPLAAGASVVSIVPTCFEAWVDVNGDGRYVANQDTLLDCGCDRLCPDDPGYNGADEGEGDGALQASWIAGFGDGRAAAGVRGAADGLRGEGDGLWARALVLEQGNTTLGIVALDLVGLFNDDTEAIRALLVEEGIDLDHLVIHATHNHEGPDTMGLWGAEFLQSGYDPAYQAAVHGAAVSAIAGAFKSIAPVKELVVGEVDISTYHELGVANVIRDSRDPWVVDEFIGAARFVGADDQTIATVISYGCHPETVADKNLLLTSDFVHALRKTVEEGSVWQSAPSAPGLGGPAIFLNAAVGGMMTTLGVEVHDPDGGVYKSASFAKADAIGQLLGEMALDAVANGESIAAPRLSFANLIFFPEVINTTYQFLFEAGVLKRTTYPPVRGSDKMRVRTEMTLINLGPIQFLSIPGELLPELAIGGYDGSKVNAPGVPLVDPTNRNPPALDQAPAGPYIKDKMSGTYRWLIGLGDDELGYIIPDYDYVLADSMPYLNEAPGDHYEETNSLGPHIAGLVESAAAALTQWSKAELE
jgi:hypothetical protein